MDTKRMLHLAGLNVQPTEVLEPLVAMIEQIAEQNAFQVALRESDGSPTTVSEDDIMREAEKVAQASLDKLRVRLNTQNFSIQ